jgi:Biotin carboxylase, N-terminal domain/Carbamoyl-phosphate synthase L chain, ATP binding domain
MKLTLGTASLLCWLVSLTTVQCFSLSSRISKTAPAASATKSRLHATVEQDATTSDTKSTLAPTTTSSPAVLRKSGPPFKNIMAANRAEIAVRIMRAATELNCGTVGVYVQEDSYSQHRWGADRSFRLERNKDAGASPISAYLDIPQLIQIALDAKVDAIHPGYGFLSESPEFAQACQDAGITFVGPTVDNLLQFSDKTKARQAAIAAGVPVVPGSDGALSSADEVVQFIQQIGLPVILKVCTILYCNAL